ncbi:MAG: hypothetical protein ACFB0B_02345 [Thermonemataceae bacterium]
MKKIIFITIIAFVGIIVTTEAQTIEKGSQIYGIGLNGGFVVRDFEEIYSANIGIDLFYLYAISDRIALGASTGFANYFGDEITMASGMTEDVDNAQFIPVAGSVRVSPIRNIILGADVGYAIGVNEDNEGGFYLSPRATYLINEKFPLFTGYRSIDIDGINLESIQFGIGIKL